jgi:hypothetical protein
MKNWEIDKLIAEKVMGYRIIPPSTHESTGITNDGYFVIQEETEDEDAIWINQFEFSPSTDIQDAWKVVEKLRSNERQIDVVCQPSVYFAQMELNEELVTIENKSAPMAICLAALKSVGIEIN